MTADDIYQNHNFTPAEPHNDPCPPSKIKVVGVGGGGNNAVNHMYNLGARNVTFIVANTDRQALTNSPVPNRVLLGPDTLRGRGAGNDPSRARSAAEESAAEVANLFDDETDMVFITAGMGGGTGTGASPVIARIAKEKGILTIGIVTIPFLFEGQKKILKALDGAKEMSQYVDALMVINNDRLSEIYSDCDFLNAFGKADDILSMAAISISEIVTCDGFINLDFNDVNATLRDGETAIISTGYGEGENRVTKAIQDALHSPLLRNTDIFGSRKLLFNLYFSRDAEDKFKIDETNQITSFISNIDPNVDVIWGVAFDESLGNKVKFTILAAGFEVTIDEKGKSIKPSEKKEEQVSGPKANVDDLERQQTLMKEYGERLSDMNRNRTEQSFIILQPDQLDDEQVFAVLEQNPAYKRDRAIIYNMRKESSAPQSTQPTSTPPAAEKSQKGHVEFDNF